MAYGLPSRPVRGSITPSARQYGGITTGIGWGAIDAVLNVPAGVGGTSSALVICTFAPEISRFTKSAHFFTGARAAEFWAYAEDAMASRTKPAAGNAAVRMGFIDAASPRSCRLHIHLAR